jgi:8-oxo-dGTP pyrophosphatase MutT (NUDIX family)
MIGSPSVPVWFGSLHRAVAEAGADGAGPGDGTGPGALSFVPPPGVRRRAGVLMLFGESGSGPDVLLTERAAGLRAHAGQVAFPGGAVDPEDSGPVAAALREAGEETGLDPAGVEATASFPELYVPVSDYVVTPVLAWWREPGPVAPVDLGEVARVVRVPVAELLDPVHRFRVRHSSGLRGPGFRAGGLFVWGFTAGVLDVLFRLAGWELPWDDGQVEDVPLLGQPPRQETR